MSRSDCRSGTKEKRPSHFSEFQAEGRVRGQAVPTLRVCLGSTIYCCRTQNQDVEFSSTREISGTKHVRKSTPRFPVSIVGAAPQGWSSQKHSVYLWSCFEESMMRSSVNGKTARCQLCSIYPLRIDEPAANCALLRHTYRVAIPHKHAAKTENALCSVMASPYCSWLALNCRGYVSIGMRSVQTSSSPVLEPFRALITREPDSDELLS